MMEVFMLLEQTVLSKELLSKYFLKQLLVQFFKNNIHTAPSLEI